MAEMAPTLGPGICTDLDGDGKVTLADYENLIIRSLEKVGIKIFY